MKKKLGILGASVMAMILGSRLVFAAFGPVLPPDFEWKYEAGYDATYQLATWLTGHHARYFALHDRWPATLEDLWDLPEYAEARRRSPESLRLWVEDLRPEVEVVPAPGGPPTVRYTSDPSRLGRYGRLPDDGSPAVECNVTLDAGYARRLAEAIDGIRGDWRETLPEDHDPWPHIDCRRVSGWRTVFAWAGFNRYRRPPPERYAKFDYAARYTVRGKF